MPVDHPAYQEEQSHLEQTLQRIDEEQRFLIGRNQDLEKEVSRTAGDPVLYNIFHSSRVNLAYNQEQLENFELIRDQAYFARLDFREAGTDETESIYLGKVGFISRQNGDVVIVDWREPVATLYYGGTEGQMEYAAPGGLIRCEVELKRQFELAGAVIKRIFDTRLAEVLQSGGDGIPRDDLLLSRLEKQADRRLRDIVSTIQKEQNSIIRAGIERPIIVQGVAGSGKTTVALHRLAYLLYRYREILTPENVLIIAPNRIFLTYISDVLPSLGVKDVTQTTLQELFMNVVGRALKVAPVLSKFYLFLEQDRSIYTQVAADLARRCSAVKGSVAFKELLDQMAQAAVRAALPAKPLMLDGVLLVDTKGLWERYNQESPNLPPADRLAVIKRSISKLVERHIAERLKECQQRFEQELEKLRKARGYGSKEMLMIYKQREEELAAIQSGSKAALESFLSGFGEMDALTIYRTVLSDAKLLQQLGSRWFAPEDLACTAIFSRQLFQQGLVEPEDLGPLAYLRIKLNGVAKQHRFQHIVIDEGQDLNALELSVLKDLMGHSSFTVVGDVSQSIQPGRGVHDWQEITQGSFSSDQCRMANLSLSYRTTAEIVLFANEVLRTRHFTGDMAKPVLRTGSLPYLQGFPDQNALLNAIISTVRSLQGEGMQTVALVTRTAEQGRLLHGQLRSKGLTARLTEQDSDQYEGGLLVIPAYLAKGLEFDAVIVCDAGGESFRDGELDAKMLYVTLTRAMHKLYVFYSGALTPLLSSCPPELWQSL